MDKIVYMYNMFPMGGLFFNSLISKNFTFRE